MDCCCRQIETEHIFTEKSVKAESRNSSKLKFSFRTQQASPLDQQLITPSHHPYHQTISEEKHKNLLGSTVATNNQLVELEREREFLLQQDRNLDIFYQNSLIPLEREMSFYESEVKVMSIQIMQLQDLLYRRLQEQNYQRAQQSIVPNHLSSKSEVWQPFGFSSPSSRQIITGVFQPIVSQNFIAGNNVTIRPERF